MANQENEEIKVLKEKIAKLLVEYRLKHDELELAVEEWDIGEIQVALDQYNREINKLKKHVQKLETEV
jgi:uncharacterized coiled-coil protein SlyX